MAAPEGGHARTLSLRDSNAKYDGFGPITQGIDSARSPYLLERTQLSWLLNGTTRENSITTRPGYVRVPLNYLNSDGVPDATVEANFTTNGRWQGAGVYEPDNGASQLIASIGGHIFVIDLASGNVQDLSALTGLYNSPIAPQVWMCQAENYLVIQNGEDDALVYDGSNLYRSYGQASVGPDDAGIPVGKQMAYNNGRLWVALPSGYAFVAGDLAYSHDPPSRGDVLSFTENTFLNGGGAFMVPYGAGPIRAMASIAIQDNSTGQGPLQVFTTRGAFSVNAPFDRDSWQNTQSPIQTISLLAAGAVAQTSTVLVNGDIWFRAPDGVRSFSVARRDHGTWVNTALSNEMKRVLQSDSTALLTYASAVLFDNRLLTTCSPRIVSQSGTSNLRGIAHYGLAVLDFEPVTSMFARTQPTWDGLWTGLHTLQLLTAGNDDPRCFLFTLSTAGLVELWELTKGDLYDNRTQSIEGAFETPSFSFDTAGFNLRQLMTGDLWLTDIGGNVNLTVSYRPDADANWVEWATVPICVTNQDCTTGCNVAPITYAPQYRARVQLPEPPSTCDAANDKPTNLGYRFAMRVAFSGPLTFQQARLTAHDVPENVVGACPPTECITSAVPLVCINDYAYVTNP